MPIDQQYLIQSAETYRSSSNTEYFHGSRLRPKQKKRVYLSHAPDDFRMVQGLIVLMEHTGMEMYFDWYDGTVPGLTRADRNVNIRVLIDLCDVFIVLVTGNYQNSGINGQELAYAQSMGKRIYVIPTIVGKTKFGENLAMEYAELDFEKTTMGKFVMKIRDVDRKNLWRPIFGGEGL